MVSQYPTPGTITPQPGEEHDVRADGPLHRNDGEGGPSRPCSRVSRASEMASCDRLGGDTCSTTLSAFSPRVDGA